MQGSRDIIADCLDALDRQAPPADILARLRGLDESRLTDGDRVFLLKARATALQRLGFSNEALGDLEEARKLAEQRDDAAMLSRILRLSGQIYAWRGDGREAGLALLGSIAEAERCGSRRDRALALVEAGRLEMEIGRARNAVPMFVQALSASADLPERETWRAAINHAQALLACGRGAEAAAAARKAEQMLTADAPPRLRFLALLCLTEAYGALGEEASAKEALASAKALLPADDTVFEHIEYAEAQANLALRRGEAALAETLFRQIIERMAGDDLAGREVSSRLRHAEALQRLGRSDEAERTLAAGLRRAVSRGLSGYADKVRSQLADSRMVANEIASTGLLLATDIERRFVRRRPLGSGGFGSVWRAYDLETGSEVAVKRLSLAGIYDQRQRERALASALIEWRAATVIDHPGVARIHGLLRDPQGDAYLVEEFIDGTTLRQAMLLLDRKALLSILSKIAFALAAIHAAHIIHRDIKPENIILRGKASDGEVAPVIVDFGIAQIGRTAAEGGTAGYMAPEQGAGQLVDGRADLHALGVIAFEMLTGALPPSEPTGLTRLAALFGEDGRNRLIAEKGVSNDLALLVLAMMSSRPDKRPAAAMDVALAFAGAVRGA